MMLKNFRVFCVLALVGFVSSAFAADEFPFHYAASTDGVQRWAAPDTLRAAGIRSGESVAYARFVDGLGVEVARSGSAALSDARAVGVVAKMGVSAAGVFTAMKALMGGPLGWTLTGLALLPAVLDWINSDGGVHVRAAPDGSGPQKNTAACLSGCSYWSASGSGGNKLTQTAACTNWWASDDAALASQGMTNIVNSISAGPYCTVSSKYSNGNTRVDNTPIFNGGTRPPDAANWVPASMDDLLPYMGIYSTPLALIPQILAAGGTVSGTPSSVITTPPAEKAPSVRTTPYPATPPVVKPPVTTPGNPFNLPANTPTITGNGTGFGVLGRGVSTITGSPWPSTTLAPSTVTSPTRTTSVSTFDGTNTKTVETTTIAPQSLVETSTPTTTRTDTPSGSVVHTDQTVTSVLTNLDDNTTTTTTATSVGGSPNQPQPTDCDKIPDSVGCTKLGMPPTAEVLPKSTVSVTLTPTVFASSASCPGDITTPINVGPFHSQAVFSFASLCSTASGSVAPIVLLLGAAAAAFIFVGGLKV